MHRTVNRLLAFRRWSEQDGNGMSELELTKNWRFLYGKVSRESHLGRPASHAYKGTIARIDCIREQLTEQLQLSSGV